MILKAGFLAALMMGVRVLASGDVRVVEPWLALVPGLTCPAGLPSLPETSGLACTAIPTPVDPDEPCAS